MEFLTGGDPIQLEHKINLKSAALLGAVLFVAIVIGVMLGTALIKGV